MGRGWMGVGWPRVTVYDGCREGCGYRGVVGRG